LSRFAHQHATIITIGPGAKGRLVVISARTRWWFNQPEIWLTLVLGRQLYKLGETEMTTVSR
jgi:hypothetical protein